MLKRYSTLFDATQIVFDLIRCYSNNIRRYSTHIRRDSANNDAIIGQIPSHERLCNTTCHEATLQQRVVLPLPLVRADNSEMSRCSFARFINLSANYINKIGWKINQPCFIEVTLKDDVPKKFLNTSAKKLNNKKKFKYIKKFINNNDNYNINDDLIAAIITPDKDIIPNSENLKPAYVVFENYEKILQWNRSLRFALAVCTLKDKFKNVL